VWDFYKASPSLLRRDLAKRLECARIPALFVSSFFSFFSFFDSSEPKSWLDKENQKRRNTAHSKRFARFGYV